MKSFFLRWTITALAVMIAAQILPGITYDSSVSLLVAALVLGILNAIIRPILLLLSLPFIVATLGFFILLVNAIVLKMASGLTPGFHVEGFWTAIFGSVIISSISWVLSVFLCKEKPRREIRESASERPEIRQIEGRVIK